MASTEASSNGTRLTAKSCPLFISGASHVGIFAESVFELSRFDAVGTVTDNVCGDCSEKFGPESVFVDDAQREVGCEAVHRLDSAFEAQVSWPNVLASGRFGHRFPDEVVRKAVSPDFFSNHFRSLATQVRNLQRRLHGPR